MSTTYLLRFDIFSHNVKVSHFSPLAKSVIMEFAKTLAERELVKVGPKRYENRIKRVYAAATADRSEFRFHINSLQVLKDYVNQRGIHDENIEFVKHEIPKPVKADFRLIDTRTPREKQIPIIDLLSSEQSTKAITSQTGFGKAQPLTAKIKDVNGWSTMGDMFVGKVITAPDGTYMTVNGVFPQGKKDIFKVTFADGRTTECCGEHLWKVFYINTSIERRWRVVNTYEIIRLLKMPNPRVYIELISPDLGVTKQLPIDPYTLGVILGDGNLSCTSVTISKRDEEIFEEIKKTLPEELCLSQRDEITRSIVSKTHGRNPLITHLRNMNLMGKLSFEKFIPEEYKNGDVSQRLAILQGLLDTDGTVVKGGSASFTSTSKQLAEDVQYIVRSLGGIAKLTTRVTQYTHNGVKKNGRQSFTVFIRHPKPTELFRLERKRSRLKDDNQYSPDLKLRIKSVEYDRVDEAQCISVTHPDKLYITDDFIVTHNTFCAAQSFFKMGERVVIIIKGMYETRWIDDLTKAFSFKKHELLVCRGSRELIALIDLAKGGQLIAQVIIITNTTYRNFIDNYELNPDSPMYGCTPENFFGVIGAGVRVIDEVHQDFHLNFKIDLYTNIRTSIVMSATLNSDSAFLNKMYALAFPSWSRPDAVEYNKYINVKALIYGCENTKNIRYLRRGQYNHILFEESIMKRQKTLLMYFKMIAEIAKEEFIDIFEPGQRLLIFCSSVEMCTKLTEFFRLAFPGISIGRYTGEDEDDVYKESDITISTLKSAGTAIDIPGLRKAIMTTAVGSRQANEQAVGRLRPMVDWPHINPEFIYLVCNAIPQHRKYHEHKEEVLSDKILSLNTYYTKYRI